MFDRFTDRARKSMGYSRLEAQSLSHDYIGTEHILLGLIREGSGTAVDVLTNLDVDLRKLGKRVNKRVSRGRTMVTMGQLPFTPRAKKVLELAYEESNGLGHNYIGTEHLLLGLIREEEGIAAHALRDMKVRLEDVREEVIELLGEGAGDSGSFRTFVHLGLEDPGFPADARETVLAVLDDLEFTRAERGTATDIVLAFEPHAHPERMFYLGALHARDVGIVLLLRPGESPHPVFAERAVAVSIGEDLEASLRAALED